MKALRDTERTGLVLLVLLLFTTLLGRGLLSGRWAQTWAFVHVQATAGGFGDSRNLPDAAAAFHAGHDPYAILPESSYPPFNYPHVWLLLASALGLKLHFLAFAFGMVAAFLLSAAALIYYASTWRGAILCTLATCTPAVLLAVERGNVDLFVFALCYVAVALCTSTRTWALLALATILKLFPAVGFLFWTALQRREKLLVSSLAAVALYLFLERGDLRGIRRNTPTPGHYAYGTGTLSHGVTKYLGHASPLHLHVAPLAAIAIELLFLGGGAGCFLLGRRFLGDRTKPLCRETEQQTFLVFASIFLGTFLAGANYVYRLIFLLPTVPFLATHLRDRRLRTGTSLTLGLLLLGMSSAPGGSAALEALSFAARTVLFFPLAFFVGIAVAAVVDQHRAVSADLMVLPQR